MLTPEELSHYLEVWQSSPLLPLIIYFCFILGSALLVPVTALVLCSAYLLPPLQSVLVSISGVVSGGLVGFFAGRFFGKRFFKAKFLRRILETVQGRISGNEIISVAIIRKLPIAPFSIVNMALGTLAIRPLYFALGSVLGALPFIILAAVFKHSYKTLSEESSVWFLALVGGLVALALLIAFALQVAFKDSKSKRAASSLLAVRK